MLKSASVEKTTKYSLSKEELEKLILREIDPTMDDGVAPHVKVYFDYSMSGGYDHYDERYDPMVFGGLTVTITEKGK